MGSMGVSGCDLSYLSMIDRKLCFRAFGHLLTLIICACWRVTLPLVNGDENVTLGGWPLPSLSVNCGAFICQCRKATEWTNLLESNPSAFIYPVSRMDNYRKRGSLYPISLKRNCFHSSYLCIVFLSLQRGGWHSSLDKWVHTIFPGSYLINVESKGVREMSILVWC